MNPGTSDWRHGFASLAILILLIAGLYFLMVQPALSTNNINAERIDNLEFQSEKFNRSKQEVDFLTSEIKQLQKQYPNKQGFLEAKAPAVVAADLQKQIKTMVTGSGGTLLSTHALTQAGDELFPRIAIKVHMRSDIKTLLNVLYQITINRPLLFTENVLIQKRHTGARNKQQINNQIEVRFDVSGYINPSST